MPLVLGDIVISSETAARQASELGHSVEDELRVLLVHGLLHLLGHDHHEEQETREMRSEEARAISALWPKVSGGLIGRAVDSN